MSKSTDGQDLTLVGPGTVMGEMMRQYWIPAALSSELSVDGDPMRLMLLGEQLIAFRDSSGRVGVLDHQCPHRCASLFLGRNEQDGIRCVYHGWKFDVDGRCLEMPNVPPPQDFKEKVRAKSYRVRECAGLIWVYMGARAEAPPMPMHEALFVPEQDLTVTILQREANWLQGLEGDIDTSHFGFLHAGHINPMISRKATRPVTRFPTERRSTRSPRPTGARCTARFGRKRTIECTGAWRISPAVLDPDPERRLCRPRGRQGVGAHGRHSHDADLDLWRPRQGGDLLEFSS